ncbi:hypothetical protein QBC34DRAFT_469908 [Podospora aff. communis PSN243]|uniref:Uncharacterized protein n=1 Tax=Podospora aff. communis PSN243 TaxID=3040156 RepID=A0AAV9GGF5_9PEZI|nr:hypothetical protein QBC34DRAFT_469908 [Podospora aff. communis PSN243]
MKLFTATYPHVMKFLHNLEEELDEGESSEVDLRGLQEGRLSSPEESGSEEGDDASVCSYRSVSMIERSDWGEVSFIDEDGHIDTWANADARGDRRAGRLHVCTWVTMPRTQMAARASAVPELVLITPEGEENGLEDMAYYPCANSWADMDSESEEEVVSEEE